VRGPQGATGQSADGARFNFQAPTTCRNAFRLLRAMQVRLPVTKHIPGCGCLLSSWTAGCARLLCIQMQHPS
jgi:midasin (ATPase involved in ribosome maturation)